MTNTKIVQVAEMIRAETSNDALGWSECMGIAKQIIDAMNGWISVEDRLPDTGVKVLAYTPNDIGINSYKQPRIRIDETLDCDGRIMFRGLDATHWQPLPSPPSWDEAQAITESEYSDGNNV